MDGKLIQGLRGKPKSIKLYEPIIKMNRGYVMRFYYGYDGETKKTYKKDVYLDLDYYFTPSNISRSLVDGYEKLVRQG